MKTNFYTYFSVLFTKKHTQNRTTVKLFFSTILFLCYATHFLHAFENLNPQWTSIIVDNEAYKIPTGVFNEMNLEEIESLLLKSRPLKKGLTEWERNETIKLREYHKNRGDDLWKEAKLMWDMLPNIDSLASAKMCFKIIIDYHSAKDYMSDLMNSLAGVIENAEIEITGDVGIVHQKLRQAQYEYELYEHFAWAIRQ